MKLLKAYLIPLFMFLPIILSARPISVAEPSTRSSITLIILIGEFSYGAKGPFGQVIAKSETVENPFQFQTKYYDQETGFSYYGYRYYDPIDGRWVNKDPIGINGGINTYNFVSNNPANGFTGGMNYSNGMSRNVGNLINSLGIDPWGHRSKRLEYEKKLIVLSKARITLYIHKLVTDKNKKEQNITKRIKKIAKMLGNVEPIVAALNNSHQTPSLPLPANAGANIKYMLKWFGSKYIQKDNLSTLSSVLSKTSKLLSRLEVYIDCACKKNTIAFAKSNSTRIHICPIYWGEDKFTQQITLLHELTHAAADTNDDGYLQDESKPNAYWKNSSYGIKLTQKQRMNNADTIAAFIYDLYYN
jgi:RHS repeat-associated protein